MSAERQQQLTTWLCEQLNDSAFELQMLAGDASFRRYGRVQHQGRSLIVMDAPPSHEDCRPFLAVAKWLDGHQVRVPHVLASSLEHGFILLEDFGDVVLSQVLTADNVDQFYGQAMNQLIHLQQHASASADLPAYDDARLMQEMRLFDQWFLPYLGVELNQNEQNMLTKVYQQLIEQAVIQPQVLVHRDYHCRNLMVLRDEKNLGVIDFQDAVIGPISYDLVSLLRDAYIQWPKDRVLAWVHTYWQRAQLHALMPNVSQAQFVQWFDWIGAQRHLKILGIFVRLSQRDGKHGYLGNLPLVLWYLIEETRIYPELASFAAWLESVVLPAFVQKHPDAAALWA